MFNIDRATVGWRPYGLLIVLCLGLYLPGIAALPPVDRDEARYIQATRQMLETGDFLRIRFQDTARNKKPAGIYWLQAAAVAATSDAASVAVWPYRLPSLAGALIAVLLTFAMGRRLVGRPAALIGAGLLAASLGLVVEAHFATTDAVLLATAVAAQGSLGEIYRRARAGERAAPWPWALLFWLALGAGILVKGPVVPALSALTVIALVAADRDGRWLVGLRAAWGIPLLAATVGPWLIAISVVTHGAFLGEAVGHDFLGKLGGAQESHGAPPGYYLALLAATFWPGSLFLAPAIRRAWSARRETAGRLLIAWTVPYWILLEIVPTKLPHYGLPLFPALALLVGQALAGRSETAPRRLGPEVVIAGLWSAVTLVLAAGLVLAPERFGGGVSMPTIALATALIGAGGGLLWMGWQRAGAGAALAACVLALAVVGPTLSVVAPSLDRLWLSRAAAALIADYRPPRDAPLSAVGYDEPSLVFLLGTRTRLLAADGAAAAMTETRGAIALVEAREDAAFRQAMAARGWAVRTEGGVSGLDYSNGKSMTLTLYSGIPGG